MQGPVVLMIDDDHISLKGNGWDRLTITGATKSRGVGRKDGEVKEMIIGVGIAQFLCGRMQNRSSPSPISPLRSHTERPSTVGTLHSLQVDSNSKAMPDPRRQVALPPAA